MSNPLTLNPKTADLTESYGNGRIYSCIMGSPAATANLQSVKWDGSNVNTVVPCTSNLDACIGLAEVATATGASVRVLGPGCKVNTGLTLSVGGKVEPSSAGSLQNYTSGTVVATVIDGTSNASIVRLCMPY
jgi:hypothetical protein